MVTKPGTSFDYVVIFLSDLAKASVVVRVSWLVESDGVTCTCFIVRAGLEKSMPMTLGARSGITLLNYDIEIALVLDAMIVSSGTVCAIPCKMPRFISKSSLAASMTKSTSFKAFI